MCGVVALVAAAATAVVGKSLARAHGLCARVGAQMSLNVFFLRGRCFFLLYLLFLVAR